VQHLYISAFDIYFMLFTLKDKAQKHKKLLDDAEEQFRFKEEAKDLVIILLLCLMN
jgi:hypothetical protein